MLSNKSNKELVEAGHQFAKALDADMPLTDIAKLVSALATRLDCAIVRGNELQQKLDDLATEAGYLRNAIKQHSESTHFCEVCGKDDPCKTDDVCWPLNHGLPATGVYLNSVRADAIPEGYVLVPQSMNVSVDAMESICFHGGDGGGQFGEFTDVVLWVGAIENDDDTKTYGLNITTAEHPEEGSANISEFAETIGSGTHDTADKAG